MDYVSSAMVYYLQFLEYFGLFVYHLYKSLSYALVAMYNNLCLRSLAIGLTKL